ncbi:Bug family tripartite tricarboxylate transporter substrate binding protein [Humitalea sp. 24SJ18S-53]|uniref:Bug family tripartite tricarboxylate transporter substrate binding protein n=1 Tax=Humitalea sp. 24SJ18S-53 TaxID=3422307 RepID=UPI003D67316B
MMATCNGKGAVMRNPMRSLLLAAGLAFCAAVPAKAQTQNQPLRLVVPFAPGGSIDIIARLLAQPLSERLGQTVVVDNRAGAAGLIAAEHVVQSPADGNTLLLASGGQVTIAAVLATNLSFNPMRDLVPVTHVVNLPYIVVAGPGLPQPGLREILAVARATPGGVTYSSSGAGSVTHLAMELLAQVTGTELLHVPYRGTAPATADLIAGRVGMTMTTVASVKAYLDRGEMRALAAATPQRIPDLPQVPTMAELGIQGMEIPVWVGMVARAGTPAPTIRRLDDALRAVLATPDMRARLEPLGAEVVATGPAAFGQVLVEDEARWRRVVSTARITLQ